MRPEQFLASRWLFTREEFCQAVASGGQRRSATASSHLGRWRRSGRIRRVKEGVYLRTGLEGGSGGTIDFLAVASKLAPDATLAYHTALEAHGLAQSLAERLIFVTWTKTRRLTFEGREFVPVQPRRTLERAGFGAKWIDTIERSGVEVQVTSLERTVVDVLDRPELAAGPEEVWRSLGHVSALDLRALEEYVAALGIKGLAAKVGFFLERRSQELVVPHALLERLRERGPRAPVYVDRRCKSRLVTRWRLVVPEVWLAEVEATIP